MMIETTDLLEDTLGWLRGLLIFTLPNTLSIKQNTAYSSTYFIDGIVAMIVLRRNMTSETAKPDSRSVAPTTFTRVPYMRP